MQPYLSHSGTYNNTDKRPSRPLCTPPCAAASSPIVPSCPSKTGADCPTRPTFIPSTHHSYLPLRCCTKRKATLLLRYCLCSKLVHCRRKPANTLPSRSVAGSQALHLNLASHSTASPDPAPPNLNNPLPQDGPSHTDLLLCPAPDTASSHATRIHFTPLFASLHPGPSLLQPLSL